MTTNNNEGPQKPGNRERKKAAPSVPTANRPTRTPGTVAKPDPTVRPKPGTGAIPPAATPPGGTRPAAPGNRPQTTMSARALTRYEKDLRRQRILTWATVGVIAFVLIVLAIGIWQTTLAPNFETLAEVNGTSISRSDYNKFRKNELFKQSGRIQQALQFSQGDQQQQYQSQLSLIQDEVLNIQSRSVNQASLESFVSQIVLEKAAKDKFGITVSDDEVNKTLEDDFRGVVYTPTANASQGVQTATAGVVATAAANFNTATAGAITPLPTPTPSVSVTATTTVSGTTSAAALTPGPTPASPLTPGPASAGTPGASSTISATTNVSATVAPTVTPQPTQTSTPIAADKVQQTASASQSSFLQSYRKFTSLSDDDYKKFESRPNLLKKKVVEKLQTTQPKVGDPYPAWQVSHILVKEEADARQIYDQLKATAPDKLQSTFVQLARDKSTDTTASSHNGDLGWITDKTSFDKDFLAAALKLDKGQLSPPTKTQFGWHIIYCTDKDPNRPLDALTIQGFTQGDDTTGEPKFYTDWLKARVDESKPKYNTPPTPTPVPTVVPAPAFTPVIPPTNTPLPTTAPAPVAATTAAGTPGAGSPAAATTAAATTAASTTAAATTVAATTVAPSPTK